jgi:integrase/recombinase XerD
VFFRYLQLEGMLVENQAELLGTQKLWQRVPTVLSSADVDALLTAPRPPQPWWRRDRALSCCMPPAAAYPSCPFFARSTCI